MVSIYSPFRFILASCLALVLWSGWNPVNTINPVVAAPARETEADLLAPGNLTAAVLSRSSIRLTWTDGNTDETAFTVERSLNQTNWAVVTETIAADTTTYTDSGLAAGTKYYYRMRAKKNTTYSVYSNITNSTTYRVSFLPSVMRNVCFLTQEANASVVSWGMSKIHTAQSWVRCMQGEGITVAVVDTGVSTSHPDLTPNLVYGWDYAGGDGDPNDENGHGSHVAGIVAGAMNAQGIVGVAPKAKILAVRVLDASGGGYSNDVADGIRYAADHGANIINLSLGSGLASETVRSAVVYAQSKGVLVVAAAGNCGDPLSYSDNKCSSLNQVNYPAAFDGVVAVASTTSLDTRSAFSTVGSYVKLAAPGSSIYSSTKGTGFATLSGTSQATPHVAGLAAAVWGENKGYSALQVFERLKSTAIDLGDSGKDSSFGYGRIDAVTAFGITGASSAEAETSFEGLEENWPAIASEPEAYVPGRVLVALDESVLGVQSALAAESGVSILQANRETHALVLGVPEGQELAWVEKIKQMPGVRFAEVDAWMYAQ